MVYLTSNARQNVVLELGVFFPWSMVVELLDASCTLICKRRISRITFEDRFSRLYAIMSLLGKCAQFQVVVLARQASLKHSVRIE